MLKASHELLSTQKNSLPKGLYLSKCSSKEKKNPLEVDNSRENDLTSNFFLFEGIHLINPHYLWRFQEGGRWNPMILKF
jgi:hypothetical protein